MNKGECIFCKIAKGEIKPEKVAESNNFVAFRDVNPITKGHTLVIPKSHYVTLLDIPDKLDVELIKMIKKVSNELVDEKLGDGFNIIMNNLECAGQFIMHAHVHVIPRREKDGVEFFHNNKVKRGTG